MNSLYPLLIAASLLAGCTNLTKTFFAHHTLYPETTKKLAEANAAVNYCSAENAVSKKNAYEFSTVVASYLDLTVSDADFYAKSYESFIRDLQAGNKYSKAFCSDLDTQLPSMTESLGKQYMRVAQELGAMRRAEMQQMAQTLSNFGRYNGPTYQMTFPQVTYVNEPPKNLNLLVNTSSGLRQCRVTREQFVFCL